MPQFRKAQGSVNLHTTDEWVIPRAAIVKVGHPDNIECINSQRPKDGTAFFVSYDITTDGQTTNHKALMTNHHVINFDNAEPIVDGIDIDGEGGGIHCERSITVFLTSDTLEDFTEEPLCLNEDTISYAFSCNQLDVTLLEFTTQERERFKEKGVTFLRLESEPAAALSVNDQVIINQYPGVGKNRKMCLTTGHLIAKPTPLLCYTADTAKGSSGSPIFNKQHQLVGIHHMSGDGPFNCGTSVDVVLKAIREDKLLAEEERQYPIPQNEMPDKEQLNQYLFGPTGVKGVAPMAYVTCDDSKYYVHIDDVTMRLRHSLHFNWFTLADHTKHPHVPWREFEKENGGVELFDAFWRLAMTLNSFVADFSTIGFGSPQFGAKHWIGGIGFPQFDVKQLKGQTQCLPGAVENLKWSLMTEDGPEKFARFLISLSGRDSSEKLQLLEDTIRKFEEASATEKELIDATTALLNHWHQQPASATDKFISVPHMPNNHVQRKTTLDQLVSLINDSFEGQKVGHKTSGQPRTFLSVWGMGGLGKTTLVAEAVKSNAVQDVFPGGVIWHEIGQVKNDAELMDNLVRLAEKIGAKQCDHINNLCLSINSRLRTEFKQTLLVLDNVWSTDRRLLFDFPTIFTSRLNLSFDTNDTIRTLEMPSGFKLAETEELFCNTLKGQNVAEEDIKAKAVEIMEVHTLCSGYPLVATILARIIAKKLGQETNGWDILDQVRKAGFKNVELGKREEFSYPHRKVFEMLDVVLENMDVSEQECMKALCIFKTGARLTRKVITSLWVGAVNQISSSEAHDLIDHFVEQSLLQKEKQPTGDILSIHGVLHDYIMKCAGKTENSVAVSQTENSVAVSQLHKDFVECFEKQIGALETEAMNDSYMLIQCSYHLLQASLIERWTALFTGNVEFLEAAAEKRVDVYEEFSAAAKHVQQKEQERLQNIQDSNLINRLFSKAKNMFKPEPQEDRNKTFINDVVKMLNELLNRYWFCAPPKQGLDYGIHTWKQQCEEKLVQALTKVVASVYFNNFRAESSKATQTTKEYFNALKTKQQSTILFATVKQRKSACADELRKLVETMNLASLTARDSSGNNILHQVMNMDETTAITVLEIIKRAPVWQMAEQNEALAGEALGIMEAQDTLNLAGSVLLLELYNVVCQYKQAPTDSNASNATGWTLFLGAAFHLHRKARFDRKLKQQHYMAQKQEELKKRLQSKGMSENVPSMIDGAGSANDDINSDSWIVCTMGFWYTLLLSEVDPFPYSGSTTTERTREQFSWKGFITAENGSDTYYTPLMKASATGFVEFAKRMLHEARSIGEDYYVSFIDYENRLEKTALQVACDKGQKEVVDLLIGSSASLYRQDRYGETCLHRAVTEKHADIVNYLIDHLLTNKHKEDVQKFIDHRNWRGKTALHLACHHCSKETVELLLAHSAAILNADDRNGTCLHTAVEAANAEVIVVILRHVKTKFDQQTTFYFVNQKNDQGQTALFVACSRGLLDVAKLLLDHSADPLTESDEGSTCLRIAMYCNHKEITKHLISYVEENNGGRLKKLINHKNKYGDTLLHLESSYGNISNINMLIDYSADMFIENNTGDTCLQRAASSGKTDVVLRLLNHTMEKQELETFINHQNHAGQTALHKACEKGRLEVVDALLTHSADPSQSDNNGSTCLHLATAKEQPAVVKRLLEKQSGNASLVKHINHFGQTSLHLACDRKHKEIDLSNFSVPSMCVLVQEGEDGTTDLVLPSATQAPEKLELRPSVITEMQTTALGKWKEIFEHIMHHASNNMEHQALVNFVNCKDANGTTALDLARKSGVESIIERLSPINKTVE